MALYNEAMAMAIVEEYQQAISMANLGGSRDVQGVYEQLGLKNSPQASLKIEREKKREMYYPLMRDFYLLYDIPRT